MTTKGDAAVKAAASLLGAGYSPHAPGTAGTLAAIPLFLLASLGGTWGVVVGLLLLVSAGVPLAGRMEVLTGLKDPPPVVIDEAAGLFVTMLGFPVDLPHLAGAFFLFRFFDVLKPFPARRLEEALPGGWGVVADDLAAGLWAWAALFALDSWLR